ncbi:MAG: hypothetical protein SPL08_00675 [Pseudomonadota bacterium]|nr:hypothetical protein [Pseudomonadota bacterium]
MTIQNADKNKTVVEYLGITGTTPVEILENTEREIEKYPSGSIARKLRELLDEGGYQLDSGKKDSNGALYPYAIRALLYPPEKDKENRLVPPDISTPARVVNDILTQQGEIQDLLDEQETQITADYNDRAKRSKFLLPTPHSLATDGMDDKEFFFRFWRSPVKKLFDYRGMSPIKRQNMLKDLYGSTPPPNAETQTPEYLIEERVQLEAERAEKLRIAKETSLFKVFNIMYGTHFPENPANYPADGTIIDDALLDTYSTLDQRKEANEYLREALELDRKNMPDWLSFMELGKKPETEIKRDKEKYAAFVIKNLDNQWLQQNSTKTFADFLKERRAELLGIDAQRQALETVIEKPEGSVDNKAVKLAQDKPCFTLKNDADTIVKDCAKRKTRRRIIVGGISALSALVVFWAGKSAFSGSDKDDKPTKAPVTQQPVTQAKKQGPAPAVVSNPQQATTNMVRKALERDKANSVKPMTTNSVQEVQTPQKPAEIIGKKGNHLIGLRWAGYKDIDYYAKLQNAPDLVFKTHFDYMNKEIQEQGLPFGDIFNPEYTRGSLKKIHNVVRLEQPDGKPIRFYIRTDGRTRNELMEDVLSFYMNCRDVLQSLPVKPENLPATQSKVMTALGPSMGWSTKQQMAWQRMHPNETQQALTDISKSTRDAISKGQVDTNDVEAVFIATIDAARAYREQHPDNKALLLTVDEVARSITNIGKEDMAQYDKLTPRHKTEAYQQIVELNQAEKEAVQQHVEERAREIANRRESSSNHGSRGESSSGSSSSSGWGTKTLLIGMGIAYLWGRKKRKGR